ncbi:MAG: hypothetical protein M0Z75_03260 [Nitrospiraceae bacterium]|nr:hypothetical protein [Nitrospiraceae bacterium]
MLDVPVSLHIFNRPLTAWRVFEKIRAVRPRTLYISADGPRADHPDDAEKCRLARMLADKVDWPCDLRVNFSDRNKGSVRAMYEGISWVFRDAEEAIIFEDDCVPDESAFRFFKEMLERYRHDERVALVHGTNFQKRGRGRAYSYYFSGRYNNHLGWATWKRTWGAFDFDMGGWPEFRRLHGLRTIFYKKRELDYWDSIFQGMYEDKIGHWDWKFYLSTIMNSGLSIVPGVNLVSHVGTGPESTHVKKKRSHDCLETEAMEFPLSHPPMVCRDFISDELREGNFNTRGFFHHYFRREASRRIAQPARRIFAR